MEKQFMTVPEAAEYTGLSRTYLRDSARCGMIPHIKSGNKYYINMPLLMEQFPELMPLGDQNISAINHKTSTNPSMKSNA